MTTRKNEPTHFIVDEQGTRFPLYITTDISRPSRSAVIVNESATGDGGVSYHNGRLQENVPVNGVLFGDDVADVNVLMDQLLSIKDEGGVVKFINPYSSSIRSNKFFIVELEFSPSGGNTNHVPFSLTFTEFREANVDTVSVNLVNFETAELYKDLFAQRQGAGT